MSEFGPTEIPRRLFIYLRALARFAAFIVLAPLIGWLVVMVGGLFRGSPEHFLRDLPLSLAYAYAIGAIPAAVAGFVVAVRDVLSRPVTLVQAAGLGAVVGAIWGVYVANEGYGYYLGTLVFIGATVAGVACWWVTRRLGRRAMA